MVMVGLCKIEINENEEKLRGLLREKKTTSSKERIHLLYLLKNQQVTSVTEATSTMGRHRVTLERWLGKYRQGGIEQLLAVHFKGGRKRHIRAEADEKLQAQLQQGNGFESYGAVQQWLKQDCSVEVSYPVVNLYVRYHLKAKLKVPRPVSTEQQPSALAAFQKHLQHG